VGVEKGRRRVLRGVSSSGGEIDKNYKWFENVNKVTEFAQLLA
jgi:hypothetical protein